jgi:hypothetical protein
MRNARTLLLIRRKLFAAPIALAGRWEAVFRFALEKGQFFGGLQIALRVGSSTAQLAIPMSSSPQSHPEHEEGGYGRARDCALR